MNLAFIWISYLNSFAVFTISTAHFIYIQFINISHFNCLSRKIMWVSGWEKEREREREREWEREGGRDWERERFGSFDESVIYWQLWAAELESRNTLFRLQYIASFFEYLWVVMKGAFCNSYQTHQFCKLMTSLTFLILQPFFVEMWYFFYLHLISSFLPSRVGASGTLMLLIIH